MNSYQTLKLKLKSATPQIKNHTISSPKHIDITRKRIPTTSENLSLNPRQKQNATMETVTVRTVVTPNK